MKKKTLPTLTEEQDKTLVLLVEAERQLSRGDRRPFIATRSPKLGSGIICYQVHHAGIVGGKLQIYPADLDELETQKLIRYIPPHHSQFDVTSNGYEMYSEIKERAGLPLGEIESSMKTYLDDDLFQQHFQKAYEKWSKAAHEVTSPQAETLLTQIGHNCREAMQEFAANLIERIQPPNPDSDKAHTVARVKAVLNFKRTNIGDAKHAFLEALIVYWGTVNDLVQRQEHGLNKQGTALLWEDARRVVFHTGIVMYELGRALR